MKLTQEARCSVYGTIHGQTGELVTIISIRGNMAIVRALNGHRYPIRYELLTCPLTPENYKPLPPPQTPQDPIKTKPKKTISNRMRDVRQDPQTTINF